MSFIELEFHNEKKMVNTNHIIWAKAHMAVDRNAVNCCILLLRTEKGTFSEVTADIDYEDLKKKLQLTGS